MDKCFVIQPFDNGNFDKRFDDIFKPAIERAELEAYRIDKDLAVTIPIEDIEKGIAESAICFAEITSDNPNVWYELGFAFACGKQVVMVCVDERSKFPFDIQHKSIIRYSTGSKSDFEKLEEKIYSKILAIKHKITKIDILNTSPVIETEGLNSHQIALLILIMENSVRIDDETSVYNIETEMGKAGYTNVATKIAFRTLERLKMIEINTRNDNWGDGSEYYTCKLTNEGENWILSNQNLLKFRKEDPII